MRKFIFFLTLLGTALGLSAAEVPDAVRVTPVTGEPIVFMFSANPEITYTATGATISTTNQDPVTFDFEAIEFIDFVKYGSVNEIAGTPVSMRVTHDAIVIENAGEGSMLSIYTLDGRCVVNTTIRVSRFLVGISI